MKSPEITHTNTIRSAWADLSVSRKARIVVSWALVAGMAALIFWMSAKDGTTLDTGSGIVSVVKAWLADSIAAFVGHPVDVSPIGHFTEYLVFGALLANALSLHVPPRRACWLAPVLASLYGVSDEIHQIFVPMRACDPADWAVDTVAGIIGSTIVIAFIAAWKKTRNS